MNRDDDLEDLEDLEDIEDIEDIDAELLLACVEPVAPLASTRAALLAAVAGPWYAPFVRRVAELCEINADAARELLVAVNDAGRWIAGMGDGVEAFHIDAGPSLSDAVVGFIRLAPGAVFPEHTHVGAEDVLVLEGAFVLVEGGRVVTVAAGEEAPMAAGARHEARATDAGCLYLGVVRGGLEFDGVVLDKDDPRI
jgi:putative transcriptional regulator